MLGERNNFVESTEYFVPRITTKYYVWTNKNFIDSTESFSGCDKNITLKTNLFGGFNQQIL